MQVQRYVSKISGRLTDRIDIHIDVPAVKFKELASDIPAESATPIRERVVRARQVQHDRFSRQKIFNNAQMTPRAIREYFITMRLRNRCSRMRSRGLGSRRGLRPNLEGEPHRCRSGRKESIEPTHDS
jgi:predicted ATPase with chaperone activity